MRYIFFLGLLACGDKSNLDSFGCTEIGCSDGLSIQIVPAETVFSEGGYAIQIYADGTMAHDCTIEMSNDPADCAGEQPCAAASDCDAIYATDNWVFRVGGSPNKITVDVYLDGNSTLSAETMPSYEEFQPNGDGCEPTCRVADTQTFTLAN